MVFHHDFKELLRSLNAEGARYLVVGAYAVAFHGQARYTKDLDLLVKPSEENAERVMAALRESGFAVSETLRMELSHPGQVTFLGAEPTRIDLLTDVTGIDFESAWKQRGFTVTDDVRIPFLGLHHLRKSKEAAGRPQDIADLERLRKE